MGDYPGNERRTSPGRFQKTGARAHFAEATRGAAAAQMDGENTCPRAILPDRASIRLRHDEASCQGRLTLSESDLSPFLDTQRNSIDCRHPLITSGEAVESGISPIEAWAGRSVWKSRSTPDRLGCFNRSTQGGGNEDLCMAKPDDDSRRCGHC